MNASETSGVKDIGAIAEAALYHPKPPSHYRVYILDELQRASRDAMQLLLKYFEDSPKTTVWIICTTEASKIIAPLRGRCLCYPLRGLQVGEIRKLVQKALLHLNLKKSGEDLADALAESGATSPRFIVQAVEKFVAGLPAKDSAYSSEDTSPDTLNFCRAVIKGNWREAKGTLQAISSEEALMLRASLAGYLRAVVLGDNASITFKAVEAIKVLSGV